MSEQKTLDYVGSDVPAVDVLVTSLGSRDGLERQRARQSLVEMGSAVVAPLVDALSSPNEHTRWEAAKALKDIGDPAAAGPLVDALEDEDFGVRWLAAEGLAALGRAGLEAVLSALTTRHDSYDLREGAHHVLRMLAQGSEFEHIAPVLTALDSLEPSITVPIAAWDALHALPEARTGQGDC
jgi:HEAT repeat protein